MWWTGCQFVEPCTAWQPFWYGLSEISAGCGPIGACCYDASEISADCGFCFDFGATFVPNGGAETVLCTIDTCVCCGVSG